MKKIIAVILLAALMATGCEKEPCIPKNELTKKQLDSIFRLKLRME